MLRSRNHRLALSIALTVSSVSLQAQGAEIFINNATFAPQQLGNIDRLVVERSGSITTQGQAVTLNNGGFLPSVSLDNAGTILSGGSRAIDTLDVGSTTGYYEILNRAGGLIQGSSDAIRINNRTAYGSLRIVNSGLISSHFGQGINLDAMTGANNHAFFVTNERGGVIQSAAGSGMSTGSNTRVMNAGAISSDAFDGINLRASTGTSITNTGQIFGGQHGVHAEVDGLLNNFGTVIGRNDAGFASSGNGTVYNQGGQIIGGSSGAQAYGDGDGVHIAGIGEVSNQRGTIRGDGAGGVDRNGTRHTSEGVSLGGGRLVNGLEALIMGADNGVVVGSERNTEGAAVGSTWLSNFGTIRGLNGHGVKFIGAFDDTVINNGLISGSNGLALDLGGGDDILEVLTQARFEGVVDGGSGHDTLKLGGRIYFSDNGSFGHSRNFESLQVQGGTWTLYSQGDFSETSRVFEGAQLINQGSIAGTLDVDQWGTYSGAGSVGNLNVNGMLVSRIETGATRVTGNLALGSQATVEFGVNPDGSSGTLQVGGTAYLNDATLRIVPGLGEYPWHSDYTVLEAGQVIGRFNLAPDAYYAFLAPELNYTATRVGMTLTRNDVDMAQYATSPNSRRLADNIQSNFAWWDASADPVYAAMLYTSSATASAALEQLAGGSNANLGAAILGSSSQVGMSMRSAMYQMGSGAGLALALDPVQAPSVAATGVPSELRNLNDPHARGRVWLQGIGGYGKLDGAHGSAGLEQRTQGTLLGVDWALDETWRVGVLGGYSKTSLDSGADDGTLDSWHAGLYALRQSGPLALRLGAAYSRHDGESKRRIEFERFSERPKGDYDADSQQAFVELGYNLGSGRLNVEPFANLGYQRYHRDGYREKGGIAALVVDGQTQDNFSSTFGMRLAHLSQLDNGISLTPRASVGWRHVYGNVDSEVRQSFVSGGNAFSVEGTALDRDSLMLEAGLGIGFSARHSLNLGYGGELGRDSRNQSLSAQWQMMF